MKYQTDIKHSVTTPEGGKIEISIRLPFDNSSQILFDSAEELKDIHAKAELLVEVVQKIFRMRRMTYMQAVAKGLIKPAPGGGIVKLLRKIKLTDQLKEWLAKRQMAFSEEA